jgi:hypothetical protein
MAYDLAQDYISVPDGRGRDRPVFTALGICPPPAVRLYPLAEERPKTVLREPCEQG